MGVFIEKLECKFRDFLHIFGKDFHRLFQPEIADRNLFSGDFVILSCAPSHKIRASAQDSA